MWWKNSSNSGSNLAREYTAHKRVLFSIFGHSLPRDRILDFKTKFGCEQANEVSRVDKAAVVSAVVATVVTSAVAAAVVETESGPAGAEGGWLATDPVVVAVFGVGSCDHQAGGCESCD